MMLGTNPNAAAVAERLPENSVGAEIGVWRGDSSQVFLGTGKVRRLYLVDPWELTAYPKEELPEIAARYGDLVGGTTIGAFARYYGNVYADVLDRFEGDPRVIVWRMPSERFWRLHEARSLDWVYLDGNHDHRHVHADLTFAWAKMAGRGGVIFGDDYGNKPGVTSAVDQFVETADLRFEVFAGNQYEIRGRHARP